MIIKLTVGDNDFYDIFSHYLQRIESNILYDLKEICNKLKDKLDIDSTVFVHYYKTRQRINEIFNIETTLTQETKDFLADRIKASFKAYIKACGLNPNTVEYLMQHLEITFPNYVEDQWENGEAFYYLQQSRAVINQ